MRLAVGECREKGRGRLMSCMLTLWIAVYAAGFESLRGDTQLKDARYDRMDGS